MKRYLIGSVPIAVVGVGGNLLGFGTLWSWIWPFAFLAWGVYSGLTTTGRKP